MLGFHLFLIGILIISSLTTVSVLLDIVFPFGLDSVFNWWVNPSWFEDILDYLDIEEYYDNFLYFMVILLGIDVGLYLMVAVFALAQTIKAIFE